MAEQDLDRSEAATPFKLERARNRGAVAKSPDVNGFAILVVAMVACFAWLPSATRQLSNVTRALLGSAGADLGNWATTTGILSSLLTGMLHLLAPLLIAVVCMAILANLAQCGAVFSAEPLTPDFTRLNPAQGLRKLFALRIVYDAAKSVVKLVLLGTVFAVAVTAMLPGLAGLAHVDSHGFLFLLFNMSGGLLAKLLAVVLVLAAIDFVYVRREYAQRMRMSRREIKDEHKQREGDPRIRQRIRELRVQMLKRSQATRQLPQADVLITNPTHVAIAISYEHGVSAAPKVVTKGAGSLALKMRDVAYHHRVPIVESPPLARALYREVDDGGYVPEQWYPQVAKILVWVLAARRAREGATSTPARAAA
jgi:flagellar biosynthetic protein FlhB